MNEVRLEVRGLTKRFGGLVAVKGIGFSIRPGEILGLIGPNGSGKLTVMKLIMRIERPNAGSVRLDGVEIAGWPTHRIARAGVGIIFQHSRPLHRQIVLEHIKLALLPDSLVRLAADPAMEGKARTIAARVGLGAVLARHPGTLARLRRSPAPRACQGDRAPSRRGARGRALRNAPPAFRGEGEAVLLVDHNVKSVAALVDRVLAMYLGERIAEGTAEAVMRDEKVRRVYLGGSIEATARVCETSRTATPLLAVEGISVVYGKAQALDHVSIEVREHEFVPVVGLNGARKTTLFNAVSGLVPYRGTIRFAGRTLGETSAAAIARGGIVQCPETRELFGEMTVEENLELGGAHLSAAVQVEQSAWLLDLFPILAERARQAARTLSGGEQQMLAIARALARLHATTEITVLPGEQNVTFALPHANRIYVLEHARIVWQGEPARFAAEAGTAYL
jgi:ABC-type branched-subunit amino acid transport system ATPase component